MQSISDSELDDLLTNSSNPVIVDFWGENCGACKMMEPILERVADSFDGRVAVAKLKVDDNPDVAAKFGVRGLPTFLLFDEGKVKASKTGAMPEGLLTSWIEQNLG